MTAQAGRDLAIKGLGKLFLHGLDIRELEPRQHGPHAAGDIEANTARGDYAAFVGIKRGHTTDRKAISPMDVRHCH